VNFPAFCDRCGAVFPSGFVFEDCTNITLSGNTAGPCPVCGGSGHIPDGVFNFLGDTVEILSAPQRTVDELTQLATIIGNAQRSGASREEVSQQIQEQLPQLSGIASLLPASRAELYSFLTLLIATIALAAQLVGGSTKPSNVTVNNVINYVYSQPATTAAPASTPALGASVATPVSSCRKVGRNEKCPCGSGLKYKRCCGANR